MSGFSGFFEKVMAPVASVFRPAPPPAEQETAEPSDRSNPPDSRLTQLLAVFNSTHDGVIVTEADGLIVAANPAACAITGYEEGELVGNNLRLLRSDRHDKDFYRAVFQTVSAEGRWQGEMWNRRKGGELYAERATITAVNDGEGRPVSYVVAFTDVSLLKHTEEQLAKLVHHDPLTGLPNRLLLLTRLEHAIGRAKREGHTGALLFLDLDRFKNVNDSLGHPAGDQLLQMVATRLGQRLRDTDTFARLGGDEFAVLLDDLPQPRHAAAVAHSLIDEMEEPFMLCGQEVFMGTSIGISIFPTDSDKPDRIIGNADAALYQAKRGGRTTFRFYTEALGRASSVRVEMETRLRRGIEQDELVLHYQPLVSVADRSILGVEALVRWRDPTLGLVPPASFIPLAEESGLIIRLGDWVLRHACSQMKAWLDAGLDLDLISVNLSPLQFRQPGLADEIRQVIEQTGLPPDSLELEITESALVEYGLEAEAKLEVLKALGVRLAIDDFGTGYSSLAYLKRFPIDKLKVDQTFVSNIPHDQADMEITSAVVGLARNLHMEVSAEGVETEAQFAFLRDQGCQSVQGNLFSRPVPAGEISRLCGSGGPGLGASAPPA